jgi:hypothetical protein
VASLLGVAGGELLIPTLVLLFGADVKLAGSLSLAVSLPTMIVGFARYSRDQSFTVLARNKRFVLVMAAGSILGSLIGAQLLQFVPGHVLLPILAAILIASAVKVWRTIGIGSWLCCGSRPRPNPIFGEMRPIRRFPTAAPKEEMFYTASTGCSSRVVTCIRDVLSSQSTCATVVILHGIVPKIGVPHFTPNRNFRAVECLTLAFGPENSAKMHIPGGTDTATSLPHLRPRQGPANRISQRPASISAGSARRIPDMPL